MTVERAEEIMEKLEKALRLISWMGLQFYNIMVKIDARYGKEINKLVEMSYTMIHEPLDNSYDIYVVNLSDWFLDGETFYVIHKYSVDTVSTRMGAIYLGNSAKIKMDNLNNVGVVNLLINKEVVKKAFEKLNEAYKKIAVVRKEFMEKVIGQ